MLIGEKRQTNDTFFSKNNFWPMKEFTKMLN